MNSIKRISNSDVYIDNNLNKTRTIDIKAIGISFYVFTAMIEGSFLSSMNLKITLLLSSIILLLLSYFLRNQNIRINKFDRLSFIFSAYFFLNIILSSFNNNQIIDFSIFFFSSLYLVLAKSNISRFIISFKIIGIFSIIYSISAFIQYLNPDLFNTYLLPLFSLQEQSTILSFSKGQSFTGITNQTSHLAGFVVSGVGILAYLFLNTKKTWSFLKYICFLLLIGALFLTSKRAHFIFMIASLILVYLTSSSYKRFMGKYIKVFIMLILVVILASVIWNLSPQMINLPFYNLFEQIISTIQGIYMGEDVSNGRSQLYNHALTLMSHNPILGIGWREFSSYSIGVISKNASQPHNIYLQLLTELGIVGFTLFVVFLTCIVRRTIRLLVVYDNLNLTDNGEKSYLIRALKFSLYYQIFFILYGFTGNLLTDHSYTLMYYFACSVTISAYYSSNEHEKYKRKEKIK